MCILREWDISTGNISNGNCLYPAVISFLRDDVHVSRNRWSGVNVAVASFDVGKHVSASV